MRTSGLTPFLLSGLVLLGWMVHASPSSPVRRVTGIPEGHYLWALSGTETSIYADVASIASPISRVRLGMPLAKTTRLHGGRVGHYLLGVALAKNTSFLLYCIWKFCSVLSSTLKFVGSFADNGY